MNMDGKNTVFQEEYKRLDALCKDMFLSREGVSEYIRQMESVPYAERRYYADWENDYKTLKRLRWIRNRLAHEVGTLEGDFCTQEEIESIRDFHRRILNVCDPLSVVRERKREEEQKSHRYRDSGTSREEMPTNANQGDEKRKSGWSKFWEKVRKLFSKEDMWRKE